MAIYAANRTLVRHEPDYGNDFVRHHLNDVLLVPAVLPLILAISAFLGLRKRGLAPRLYEVLVPVIIWSVAFEWVGPMWFRRGTGDPLDALAYASGGIVSWMIWRRRSDPSWRASNIMPSLPIGRGRRAGT